MASGVNLLTPGMGVSGEGEVQEVKKLQVGNSTPVSRGVGGRPGIGVVP